MEEIKTMQFCRFRQTTYLIKLVQAGEKEDRPLSEDQIGHQSWAVLTYTKLQNMAVLISSSSNITFNSFNQQIEDIGRLLPYMQILHSINGRKFTWLFPEMKVKMFLF